MGSHRCKYLTREEAEAKDLKHINYFYSSGDTTLSFASGRTWRFPDMLPLYIELGWLPPQEFIDDILSGEILNKERLQSKSMPQPIGYISPETHPLPLRRNESVPDGLEDKISEIIKQARTVPGRRKQYRGGGPRA